MDFFSNFSPIILCSNLCSKLFENGEKMLKNPFSFLQFTKKAQKAILWSRIHFFVKFVIFAGKLLSFRILHLACPKLVGTPCRRLILFSPGIPKGANMPNAKWYFVLTAKNTYEVESRIL